MTSSIEMIIFGSAAVGVAVLVPVWTVYSIYHDQYILLIHSLFVVVVVVVVCGDDGVRVTVVVSSAGTVSCTVSDMLRLTITH